MGNSPSSNPAAPYTHGHHVVRVKPNSPGHVAGLVPYFDYIVRGNDVVLNQQTNEFVRILQDNVGKPVKCIVYNSKTEKLREVTITPNSDWDPNKKELLGVSIRFCNIKASTEYVWHILEVFPNSPASTAGLRQYTDYIVGSTSLVFQSSEDFFNLIASNIGSPLDFFVYNCEDDSIRMVTIKPDSNWGGQGSLGCNVAYGLLHKIPTKDEEQTTLQIPEPEPLPASVTAPSPIIKDIPSENNPTNITQTKTPSPQDSPKVPEPVSPQNPESAKLPTLPVSARLPTNYAASVPNTTVVEKPEPLPAPLPIPHAASQVTVASSSGNTMDLEALKKKQEQLQQQLQRLRSQMI